MQGSRIETRVSIRGATPADGEALRGMFSRASSETLYLRFHTPYPAVPEWMLALMLDLDHPDKEFLLAAMFAGTRYTIRDGQYHVRMPLGTSEPAAHTSRALSRVA